MPTKNWTLWKEGGDRKINYTPRDVPTNNHTESYAVQSHHSTSAGIKVTKTTLIHKLSIVTRNYWEAQMQNEVAILENRSLIKKVSKSKEVVECLCTCLKDSRQEMRSTKSDLVKAL